MKNITTEIASKFLEKNKVEPISNKQFPNLRTNWILNGRIVTTRAIKKELIPFVKQHPEAKPEDLINSIYKILIITNGR